MLSLEPFTIADLASPQVFQTGETFQRAPLIDYQHPHDLIMGLGSAYARPWSRGTWTVGAAIVGLDAFGPEPFMHRASAADNPTAPLSHHYLDSMHITPGVITAGTTLASWSVAGSWFHGREPARISTWERSTPTRSAWDGHAGHGRHRYPGRA